MARVNQTKYASGYDRIFSKEVTLTKKEFDSLSEYSCSIPTGTTIGKKWKRNQNFHFRDKPESWWLGEYTVDPDPKKVGIRWKKIKVINKNDAKSLRFIKEESCLI